MKFYSPVCPQGSPPWPPATLLGKLGLLNRTGIDIPGEASTIIHKIQNVGEVELATMSFGQSFQITPMQYLVAASAVVNGGTLVTPHFAVKSENADNKLVEKFQYKSQSNAISKNTSETMKFILEKVVSEGTGSKGQVPGFKVGGKTATSQKLPRGSGRYIASYMSFAPADKPKVIAMAIIDEPKGIYYGGQVAAPLISQLYKKYTFLIYWKERNKENKMSTNISKQKREDLLNKIKEIRTFISAAPQDENTGNLLSYLSDLEKDVNGKKYGLVFEEHREEIDEVLDTHTPVLTEDKDLFIDNGGQMNFLIEGDNLASLKLLEKTHKGKIDLFT